MNLQVTTPSGRSSDALPSGLESNRTWFLNVTRNGPSPGSSQWLQAIAYVLCEPPMRSFVRDPAQLCAGLTPSSTPSQSTRRGGAPAVDGRPLLAATHPAHVTGRSAVWQLPAFSQMWFCFVVTPLHREGNVLPERPCWLAGLGSREINSGSPDEVALARRLGAVFYPMRRPNGTTDSISGPWPDSSSLDAEIREALPPLTQAYDRSLFGEEPPRPPADDGSVLLAVIVVFPELVALVVLLVSTTVWRTWDFLVLFFIFVAGLVSMSGIIALAVWEAQGDSWSVAAVKDELRSEEFTILNIDAYALRTETLFLCTRTGYRAGLLQGIAVGMAVAYVAVSAAVSGTVWVLRLCGKRRPGGEGGAFVDVR